MSAEASVDPITEHVSTPPTVGRIVHYVSHGSPVRVNGTQKYVSQCRAAIITDIIEVSGFYEAPDDVPLEPVSLAVLNPTGLFFAESCERSDAFHAGGTWHWPERS